MLKYTGTTICGLTYKDGIMLVADTRATMKEPSGATTLIDQNCSKINRLSRNIYCCGAGSAADIKKLSAIVETYLATKFSSDSEIPVICLFTLLKRTLYKFNGYLMTVFIVGGVDCRSGNQIFSICQHGNSRSQHIH